MACKGSGVRIPLPPPEIQGNCHFVLVQLLFMKFTVAVTHEGNLFVARCLDVDVVSQGTNFEEAVANLEEALALYFEDEKLPESLEPPVITTVLLPA